MAKVKAEVVEDNEGVSKGQESKLPDAQDKRERGEDVSPAVKKGKGPRRKHLAKAVKAQAQEQVGLV